MSFRYQPAAPDQERFLNCVRSYFGADPVSLGAGAERDQAPDWDQVISLASYHGVIPLVHACSSPLKSEIPRNVERRLQRAFFLCAANSLRHAHELAELDLQAKGVRAIAFKGPALGIQLYGGASLRQCRDLDILVAEYDVCKALNVLCASGYRLHPASIGRADAFQTDKHLVLVRENSGVRLELHWAIAKPQKRIRLRFDELWDRRTEVSVCDTAVAVPGPNDQLIILCVHGASHYWTSLKWVCDIAALLRKYPGLDWAQLAADAKSLGCWRMVLVGLSLAKEVDEIELPPAVQHDLERENVQRLRDDIRRRILCMRTLNPENSLDGFERLFTDIRIRERAGDRIRIAARRIRSVLTREAHHEGPRLVLLPLRILRLVRKSSVTLLSLIGHVFELPAVSKTPSPAKAHGAARKVP